MELTGAITPSVNSDFRSTVERLSSQHILRCYQCGKCSAGCPGIFDMDLGPRRVIRTIQMGLKEHALSCNTIWLCMFCQTCSVRCPLDIDIARIMEALRIIALQEHKTAAVRDIKVFHDVFMQQVKRWGRVYELGLAGLYNLNSGKPIANLSLLPGMVKRGKLKFLPNRIKSSSEVKKIFDRVQQIERSKSKVVCLCERRQETTV